MVGPTLTTARGALALVAILAGFGCVSPAETTDAQTDGTDESRGSGDGEPGDGEPGDGEPGDGDGEPGGGDGDGDPGDGDGEPEDLDCLRGVERDGAPGVLAFEGCALACADGWGHPSPTLEAEWVVDLEAPNTFYLNSRLFLAPDGRLRLISIRPSVSPYIHTLSPDGAIGPGTELAEASDNILAATHDADGILYLAEWDLDGFTDKSTHVHAYDGDDQHLWTETIDDEIDVHQLERRGAGLGGFIAWRSGDFGFDHQVFAWAEDATHLWQTPSFSGTGARIYDIAVSAAGDVAMIDDEAWAILDATGVELPAPPQQTVTLWSPSIRWLDWFDDETVLQFGTLTDEANIRPAALLWQALAGPSMMRTYTRATIVCDGREPIPPWEGFSHEHLLDAAELPDGSLVLAGQTQLDIPSAWSSMMVLHVSEAGEFLGHELGLWPGRATSVSVDADGAAYVFVHSYEGAPSQIRKYAL